MTYYYYLYVAKHPTFVFFSKLSHEIKMLCYGTKVDVMKIL